jgi:hypothetical protein
MQEVFFQTKDGIRHAALMYWDYRGLMPRLVNPIPEGARVMTRKEFEAA